MTPESITFLEANRCVYDTLMKAGTLSGLDHLTKQGFADLIRKEWDPGYMVNLTCGNCISDMVKYAYTQYDKSLSGRI